MTRRNGRSPGRGSGRPSGASRGRDSGRSTARPDQRRRTGTSRHTVDDPAKPDTPGLSAPELRRRFTGRAAVLLAVVCLLVVGLAAPLREYVAQQQRIAELEAKEQRQREDITRLQRQRQRWEDPAYIEQQARERLHYAKPGEVTYVVIDDEPTKGEKKKAAERTGPTWSQRLWSSVRVADRPRG